MARVVFLTQFLLIFAGRLRCDRYFLDIRLKIQRLLNFNMLFQFLLTELSKSKLFTCLQKVDHVSNYCKRPISVKWGLKWSPCLVELFINELKTKFNNLFYRMILKTKRIHISFRRNFPTRAKQTPSKVLFVGKKKRRPRPFGHCVPKV